VECGALEPGGGLDLLSWQRARDVGEEIAERPGLTTGLGSNRILRTSRRSTLSRDRLPRVEGSNASRTRGSDT
jgi:hypothetical protein